MRKHVPARGSVDRTVFVFFLAYVAFMMCVIALWGYCTGVAGR